MLTATIIDYGVGNLFSVSKALEKCGIGKVVFAKTASQIAQADRLILPGVGAFSNGMSSLENMNLVEPIKEYLKLGRPFMGICLGMQMLGTKSSEFGNHKGLNLIRGSVVKIPSLDSNGSGRKVPFVGWAELDFKMEPRHQSNLFSAIPYDASVYLVHSYQFVAEDPSDVTAYYHYNGIKITAAIQYENIFGVQFHPEKSSGIGLRLLKNFIELK